MASRFLKRLDLPTKFYESLLIASKIDRGDRQKGEFISLLSFRKESTKIKTTEQLRQEQSKFLRHYTH